MRVGLVAKGLLLKGDLDLELVLLCKEKPNNNLLKRVSENLLTQLKVRTRLCLHSASDREWRRLYSVRCIAQTQVTEEPKRLPVQPRDTHRLEL